MPDAQDLSLLPLRLVRTDSGLAKSRKRKLSVEEFRIFDLEADDDLDAPIRGWTRVVPLDSEVSYEALSYVWGDVNDRVSITVDGRELSVTRNLSLALRRVRFSRDTRTLWVDQVCIDQADDEEKGNQVPLMGGIFSRTKQGIFWWGEIREDIPLEDAISAVDILEYVGRKRHDEATRDDYPACLASSDRLEGPMRALRALGVPENVWWQRSWTLQEAALCPAAEVRWGPLRIAYGTIADAFGKDGPQCGTCAVCWGCLVTPYLASWQCLSGYVCGMCCQWRDDPLDAITRWAPREATNPLDRVYAYVGVFSEAWRFRESVALGYRGVKPWRLYATFTVGLIESGECPLHPLAMFRNQCLTAEGRTPGLPSWAIDIAARKEYSPVPDDEDVTDSLKWASLMDYDHHDASAGVEMDQEALSFEIETGEMTLRATHVDIAGLVADPFPEQHGDGSEDEEDDGASLLDRRARREVLRERLDSEVAAHVRIWKAMAETLFEHSLGIDPTTFDPGDWLESFWRGLCGNENGRIMESTTPATEEDLDSDVQYVETGARGDGACDWVLATVCRRTMFVTEKGYLGFGQRWMESEDQVWILHGCNMPMILRPVDAGKFEVVGPAYVEGMMEGEMLIAAEGRSSIITLV